MDDRSSVTADTLDCCTSTRIAIRAGLEEVSLWIKQRGSTNVHDNVLTALAILDANAEGIAATDLVAPELTTLTIKDSLRIENY